MNKNMECCVAGGLLIVVHRKEAPSTEEWGKMLALFAGEAARGILVYTEGGSPSAFQRKQLREAVELKKVLKAAILTNSTVARIAITAINLFTKGLSTPFPPTEIDAALSFLALPRSLWPETKRALFELKKELGLV